MNEIEKLKDTFNIQKVIITPIEEYWEKSYDDYFKLQEEYTDILFVYDGIELEI